MTLLSEWLHTATAYVMAGGPAGLLELVMVRAYLAAWAASCAGVLVYGGLRALRGGGRGDE